MNKEVILTKQGLDELKSKIEYLSTERRLEVAERIKEAREFGDITENSEYDDAKNEQAMLEARIAQVEDRLRSATVIAAEDVKTDVVQVGATVSVKDEDTGKALIGKKRGEIVSVPVPRGPARKLKITKIEAK